LRAGKESRLGQGTRRQRELERHRMEVLDAAERLLARQPYTSISVQQIAEESEFSVGYLYKLFASKDELYLALVEHRKDEILELIESVSEQATCFTEGLRTLVSSIQIWLREHEGFARDNRTELMVLLQRHHKCVEDLEEKDARMQRPVLALFGRGIEEGVVGGADPELMARTLRALIWGYTSDDFHPAEETLSNHAEHIVQIILRTYSPHWKEHD